MNLSLRLFLLCLLLLPASGLASTIIELGRFEQGPIGKQLVYIQEQDKKLTLAQAIEKFDRLQGKSIANDSLSLGIGVQPVWLKATVFNERSEQTFRLAIETPWLDYIDTYLVESGEVAKHIQGGDGYAYKDRPMPYRYYAFETQFSPGQTDIYIRIESVGPMAIPVHLMEVNDARARDILFSYEYGFLYGIIIALVLYNLVLYILIRKPEYGLYSLYLFGFVVNSLSYTGQLHTVFTPDYGPYFQDWMDIFLMVTYSVFGLHFARILLATKEYAPRLESFTFWVATIIPAGMLFGALINNLQLSMLLAFILNTNFVFLFIALGYQALKAKVDSAIIFVISSVTAATCICISTAAVFGLLPLNNFTFKLIEIGMAFEAVLLAVLLAQRFRVAQNEKIIAENWARTDELTGLNNRRGFSEVADKIWASIIRQQRDVSLLILDIDKFKSINDTYGHHGGDIVLAEIANRIEKTARKSDVVARWGGEEFIVLLPETPCSSAYKQAERIRQIIANQPFDINGRRVDVTASIGIIGSTNHIVGNQSLQELDLEHLINKADEAMYTAKSSGRNQVILTQIATPL